MPIEHVVLIKAAPGCDPQEITALAPRWRELIGAIPGVEYAELGPISSPDAKGFTHMVLVRFTDATIRKVFDDHPNHDATRALLKGKMSEFLVADLTVDTPRPLKA